MGLSVRRTVCGLLAAGLAAAATSAYSRFLEQNLRVSYVFWRRQFRQQSALCPFMVYPLKNSLFHLRTMFMHNGWYVYRSANFYAQFTPEEQSKKGRSRKKIKQKISEHSSEVEQNEQNQTD